MTTLNGPMVPPASGGPAKAIVVLLHGYGSNGDDLIGLVPYWQAALPDVLFLSPNAPQPCPGVPGGYQWWPLQTLSLAERQAGARSAGPILDAFLDGLLAQHGLSNDRLALVGFSQGTMMALHVGPRRINPLAGVVAYSGMLTDEAGLEAEIKTRPPVLLVHGDADATLEVGHFHHAKAALERLNFDLTAHVSPGLGHGIDAVGLKLGETFLKRVLG